jgi:hypothetical protein
MLKLLAKYDSCHENDYFLLIVLFFVAELFVISQIRSVIIRVFLIEIVINPAFFLLLDVCKSC